MVERPDASTSVKARLVELVDDVEKTMFRLRDVRRITLLRVLAELNGTQAGYALRASRMADPNEVAARIVDRLENVVDVPRMLLEDAVDAWIATKPQSTGRAAKEAAWTALCEAIGDAWALSDAEEHLATVKKARVKRPKKRARSKPKRR